MTTTPESNNPTKLSFIQVIASVLAAAFGVQSQKNRERDFQSGSGKIFVLTGIAATVLFVILLYGIVKMVLAV